MINCLLKKTKWWYFYASSNFLSGLIASWNQDKKINYNAYVVDFLADIHISRTFNMADLDEFCADTLIYLEYDSRSSSLQVKETDVEQLTLQFEEELDGRLKKKDHSKSNGLAGGEMIGD